MAHLGADWIAAIALSIQAGIFAWQGWILRRHAKTLEQHTEIAKTQADTAALIGRALDQQGKLLDEQTKIMADQFAFQRRLEETTERGTLFNLVVEVQARLQALLLILSHISSTSIGREDHNNILEAYKHLSGSLFACEKALFTAIHLPTEQKLYFLAYCKDVSALRPTGNVSSDYQLADRVRTKYADLVFNMKLAELGQAPDETIGSPVSTKSAPDVSYKAE